MLFPCEHFHTGANIYRFFTVGMNSSIDLSLKSTVFLANLLPVCEDCYSANITIKSWCVATIQSLPLQLLTLRTLHSDLPPPPEPPPAENPLLGPQGCAESGGLANGALSSLERSEYSGSHKRRGSGQRHGDSKIRPPPKLLLQYFPILYILHNLLLFVLFVLRQTRRWWRTVARRDTCPGVTCPATAPLQEVPRPEAPQALGV